MAKKAPKPSSIPSHEPWKNKKKVSKGFTMDSPVGGHLNFWFDDDLSGLLKETKQAATTTTTITKQAAIAAAAQAMQAVKEQLGKWDFSKSVHDSLYELEPMPEPMSQEEFDKHLALTKDMTPEELEDYILFTGVKVPAKKPSVASWNPPPTTPWKPVLEPNWESNPYLNGKPDIELHVDKDVVSMALIVVLLYKKGPFKPVSHILVEAGQKQKDHSFAQLLDYVLTTYSGFVETYGMSPGDALRITVPDSSLPGLLLGKSSIKMDVKLHTGNGNVIVANKQLKPNVQPMAVFYCENAACMQLHSNEHYYDGKKLCAACMEITKMLAP